jgi:general stress protein CsbA
MFMGIAVAPIVALIAGILILFIPRLLNYIVALYLITIGVLGLIARYAPGVAI